MTRYVDCAGGCLRYVAIGPGSLPEGEATCRSCRRTRRANLPPPPRPPRPARPNTRKGRQCAVCGATYNATYTEQRTCGRACGTAINASTARLRAAHPPSIGIQAELQVAECRRCGDPFLTAGRSNICPACPANYYHPAPPAELTCQWCGNAFISDRPPGPGNRRTRYCTRTCSRRAGSASHKRQHGKFTVTAAARLAIYTRDRYACHLCMRFVRTDVPSDHPWSPTLDHLIPRSAGGPDTPDNLATAHRWCNTRRGAAPLPNPTPLTWTDMPSGIAIASGRWVNDWQIAGPPVQRTA